MFISLLEWIDKSNYIRDELRIANKYTRSTETKNKINHLKTDEIVPDDDVRDHIYHYTEDSSSINSRLWDIKNTKKGNPDESVKKITKWIAKQPAAKEDMSVYSGISDPYRFDMHDHSKNNLVHIPAFISTSMTPAVAHMNSNHNENSYKPETHILKINIKKGQNIGASIQPYSLHSFEDEYLIKPNNVLKIDRKPIIQIHDKKDMYGHVTKTRVHIWNARIMDDDEIEANKEHPEVKSYLNMKKSTGL